MDDTKDQVQGKAEEEKGQATGNTSDELQGKAEQAWSDAENKAQDAKDKISQHT